MTTRLSEALADLAESVDRATPGPDPDDTLAAVAWSSGRRRRRRSRAARASLLAVAVLALVAAVAPVSWRSDALPAAPGTAAPLGHPVRIAKPWTVSALPRRAEPLAGVALSGNDLLGGDWYAVTQAGGLHRLPVSGGFQDGVVPTVSADGRLLGYLDSGSGRYTLRDVVSGRATAFPDVGALGYPDAQHEPTWPYGVGTQSPGYFSPDGSHVVVAGGTTGNKGRTAFLVLGTDGSVRPLAFDVALGLVGWLDDRTLLAMDSTTSGPQDDLTQVLTPVRVSLDGATTRLPALRPSTPISGFGYTQWSPALSPDRRSLALGLGGSRADAGSGSGVLVFDLASGREVDSVTLANNLPGLSTTASHAGLKHLEWQGSTWYGVPPTEPVTTLAARAVGDAAVVVDPRLEVGWLDLADDALSGPAHGNLLGTRTGWAAWHWRELLLGVAAVAVLALTRRWSSRRWSSRRWSSRRWSSRRRPPASARTGGA